MLSFCDFSFSNPTMTLRDRVQGRTVLVVCLRWTGMLMVLVLSSPTEGALQTRRS